ncbi:hypothetical protein NIES39_J01000 [Arthrospira platensis NIES-39]|nr:hypothetical protein NIES39_J01000 [Arthrospira platensis NIES-39]
MLRSHAYIFIYSFIIGYYAKNKILAIFPLSKSIAQVYQKSKEPPPEKNFRNIS